MTAPDVLVIGAGIVGAAVAHELRRRGLTVNLLDARRPAATDAGMGHLVTMDEDAAEKGERRHEADGAVAAHAEVADVVEVDDAAVAAGMFGLAEHATDDDIVAAWLVGERSAPVVVLLSLIHI